MVTGLLVNFCAFSTHWRFLYFHDRECRDAWRPPKREKSLLDHHVPVAAAFLFTFIFGKWRKCGRTRTKLLLRRFGKTSCMLHDQVIGRMGGRDSMGTYATSHACGWLFRLTVMLSTMILRVNVGFLAIPGVVLSNLSGSSITGASQVSIFKYSSQNASSHSAEASIGSIVTGLLLARHNRTKQREDLAGAVSRQSTYLYQNSHPAFGLQPMAIILSLPWALLMWSYVISTYLLTSRS